MSTVETVVLYIDGCLYVFVLYQPRPNRGRAI